MSRMPGVPVALLALLLLAGCATEGQSLLQAFGAARESARRADQQPLNPEFAYLRATGGGLTVLMARGSVDPSSTGPVEVWYTGGLEVIRLEQGRLVAATGLPVEWSGVVLPPLPEWREILTRTEPLRWERRRDVAPGYRYGLVDRLVLVPVAAGRPGALVGDDPARLLWFEERSEDNTLPPARYALDTDGPYGPRVVYAEQCLDSRFCLTWQQWPPPGLRK